MLKTTDSSTSEELPSRQRGVNQGNKHPHLGHQEALVVTVLWSMCVVNHTLFLTAIQLEGK